MKLKLDLEEITDEFFEDTRIIGIVAPIKQYHFCWAINVHLGFDFRINNDIEIAMKKKERTYYFSIAQHGSDSHALHHYIYSNKYDGEFLLPEYKNLDFIWLMKGERVEDEYFNTLLNEMRNIHSVQLVAELAKHTLKNRSHMIF